jgi:glycogen operon protein
VTPEEAAKRRREREDEAELLAAMAGGGKAPVVHAAVAKTPSQIMLIQADDLGGEIEPLNVPGTDTERPNWRRRLTADVEDLTRAPPGAEIIAAVKAERPS